MNNWFYASPNGQTGPVDDETFRQLVATGEIGPDTLVWHSGMTDWEPLRTAAPDLCTAPPAFPADAPSANLGENASFADIKNNARRGLEGNLGMFLGAGILLWLILLGANIVPIIGGLAASIVLAPLVVYGVANLALRVADHRRLQIEDGFVGFQGQFQRALSIYWLRSFYLFLWGLPAVLGGMVFMAVCETSNLDYLDSPSGHVMILAGMLGILLLSIPAMIKGLSYSMSTFLMLDNPAMSASEAITASRTLMNGQKARLVLFFLSFIGWWLLMVVTFGLAGLWVLPYLGASTASFYRSIRNSASAATPLVATP